MGEDAVLYPRAPMVTFEVPLHPPVPDTARPYWWGNSTLTFRDERNRVVWEGTFPHPEGHCRVQHRPGFGWIIVLTVSHDRARKVMDAAGIADKVVGAPTSRWSYWGEVAEPGGGSIAADSRFDSMEDDRSEFERGMP